MTRALENRRSLNPANCRQAPTNPWRSFASLCALCVKALRPADARRFPPVQPPRLRYRSRMRQPLRLCVALALLLAPILRAQTPDAPNATPRYTIDAIRYATIPGFAALRPHRRRRQVPQDRHRHDRLARPRQRPHHPLRLRLLPRAVLQDSGPSAISKRPDEAVAKLGLKPADITDVIITHMHWDHADGMDLFPKAQHLAPEGRVSPTTPATPGNPGAPTAASTPTTSWPW